jgi:hypothetical protein
MTETPNLALPLMAAAQAQKHVTHNEALALIDALTQLSVLSRSITAPPTTPAEGARYLVPAGAGGGFSGKATQVALFDGGGWRFLPPKAGWLAYVVDEAAALVWNGASWIALGQVIGGIDQLAALGIGTASDGVNRLALRAQGALMTARRISAGGTGDMRLTLEKEAAARTGSLLFQTNYSGRAEMGLMGDDGLRVKVSADGAVWRDAMTVSQSTGQVSFPNGVSGFSGGAGALVLIESKTASSSAAITFTAGLNDTLYDDFVITLSSVKPSADDVALRMRVGAGAGPTYHTSGYASVLVRARGGSSSPFVSNQTGYIGLTENGGTAGLGNAAGENFRGSVRFSNPESSDFCEFSVDGQYSMALFDTAIVTGGGRHNTPGTVTGIEFSMSGGMIASGRFSLYGVRKS